MTKFWFKLTGAFDCCSASVNVDITNDDVESFKDKVAAKFQFELTTIRVSASRLEVQVGASGCDDNERHQGSWPEISDRIMWNPSVSLQTLFERGEGIDETRLIVVHVPASVVPVVPSSGT